MSDEEDDNEICCKVVLIGNSGVGKTCIINQFISNEFNDQQFTTTGATFSTKKLFIQAKKKTISFEIWDTAGQEKYRALTKMFYKDSSIVIIVYDITRKESFDEIKNYWFKEVKENTNEDVIMALIGNKNDLIDMEEIKEEEARNFANENGIYFACVSAKMKMGIEELFKDIGLKYLDTLKLYNKEETEKKKSKKKINKKDLKKNKKKNKNFC